MAGEFSNWNTGDIKYARAQTRCQFIDYSDALELRLSTAFAGENHQGPVRSNRILPLILSRNHKGRHGLTLSN